MKHKTIYSLSEVNFFFFKTKHNVNPPPPPPLDFGTLENRIYSVAGKIWSLRLEEMIKPPY